MKDPTTLDGLYGLLHSSGFSLSLGGGRWHNKNVYPGSEDAKFHEWQAESRGELATNVPTCPYWERVCDCATLAGIDPDTLPDAKHYCGSQMPDMHMPGAFTSHGPRPEPYASCYGVAVLLADQLRRARSKRPSKKEIEAAHKLSPEERDALFARLDAANEGKILRREFVKRAGKVLGTRAIGGQAAVLQLVGNQLWNLTHDALGVDEVSSSHFYLPNSSGCPVSPNRGW